MNQYIAYWSYWIKICLFFYFLFIITIPIFFFRNYAKWCRTWKWDVNYRSWRHWHWPKTTLWHWPTLFARWEESKNRSRKQISYKLQHNNIKDCSSFDVLYDRSKTENALKSYRMIINATVLIFLFDIKNIFQYNLIITFTF